MTESLTPEQEELRRRLDIFLNQDQEKVERYLHLNGYKINMKAIQEIRDEPKIITEPESMADSSSGKEDPTYTIELSCPCCRYKGIIHRELRASALSVKNDAFLAPVYFPIGKSQALNYLTIAVAVCPKCFFASPDKKDFVQFNRTTRQSVPSQIPPGILSALQDDTAARQEIVETSKLGADFTGCPRPYPLAILSYRLANARARIEAENKVQFAIYKRANYATRLALLHRQAGLDDTAELENALALFKDAFYRTDFPNANSEFQSCFIIFTILIRFGKMKEARDYVTVMEQSKKEVEERKDRTAGAALSQWLGMSKARWEDKDNPKLWEIPT